MKKLFFMLGMIVLFSFSACKKNNKESEVNKPDHFEFIISNNYLQNNANQEEKAWIMVYGSNMDLLHIQQIENGMSYVLPKFENASSGNFMVQVFRRTVVNNYNSLDLYGISAFPNVEPATWQLGQNPAPKLTPIGQNSVCFDFPFMQNNFNNAFRNKYSDGNVMGTGCLLFDQYFNPDNIWVMYALEDEVPHYVWLDNVGLNENFNLSETDFKQMTDYVDINFENFDSREVYIESEDDLSTDYWEYYPVFSSFNGTQPSVRAYYPGNLFPGYYTYMTSSLNNVTELMLKKRGSIPSKFDYLSADINIINPEVKNFKSSPSGQFDYAKIYWSHSANINGMESSFQYVICGSNDMIAAYSAPDLPDEILAENEGLLQLGSLVYSRIDFYEFDAYKGYGDYIINAFTDPGSLENNINVYHRKMIYSSGKGTKTEHDAQELLKHIHENTE